MKPTAEIEYCPGCRWLLRAGWSAQELLTTFESELGAVTLRPSEVSGTFRVSVDAIVVWDRKAEGRFPEMKELKQRIRDHIAPERDLGHSDVGQEASDA
jgi:selenoprotein W-related protein